MSFETALNSLVVVGSLILMVVLAPVAIGIGGLVALLILSGLVH